MMVDKLNEILLIVQLFPFSFKKKWKNFSNVSWRESLSNVTSLPRDFHDVSKCAQICQNALFQNQANMIEKKKCDDLLTGICDIMLYDCKINLNYIYLKTENCITNHCYQSNSSFILFFLFWPIHYTQITTIGRWREIL